MTGARWGMRWGMGWSGRARWGLLLGVVVGLSGCRSEPPNLLLVSVDTLRADHLATYGYERDTSPAIDALAREGVLWENAYATSPATVASHASLFTGRFPYQHRTLNYGTPLPDPELTLAEILSGAGYRTFAVATSVRFLPISGFPQGFDHYETLYELPKSARSRAATDRVLELAAGGGAQPFFGFVHYFGPHTPYWPPEPYRSRWHPGPAPPLPGGPGAFVHSHREPGHGVSAEVLGYLEALYDAEILYLDRDLARLFEGLDALGLTERTLVVLVSDHGEEFKDHGGLAHARTLYEEALRIPLVLRWPGELPGGRRVERPAQLVDVLPTVLDLMGQPIPPGLPGRSLAGDLGAEPGSAPDLVLGQRGTAQWSVAATLPEGRLKALHEDGRPPRLFDLDADPREQRDLRRQHPEVVERLTSLAPARLREGPESGESIEIPEEVRRRLAEIGYAEEVAGEGERGSATPAPGPLEEGP